MTWGDVEHLVATLMDQVAKVAEAIEANEQKQGVLNHRIDDFEEKLVHAERSFYSQVFPFLAVFVAAFALIITGAQGVMHISATDPLQIALQSFAMIRPVALLVSLIVLFAWLISRPRRL